MTPYKVAARFLTQTGRPSWRLARCVVASDLLAEIGVITAGALRDVSHLRYQAVFLMGAGGSGKGFVGDRWLKYMPGAPSEGLSNEVLLDNKLRKPWFDRKLTELERGLSNLSFEKAVETLKHRGFQIEVADDQGKAAVTPFRLYTYDQHGHERLLPKEKWERELPPDVYRQVKDLEKVVFSTPVHELPSYWRQVNPDIYKEELAGYLRDEPGYVHEMSSEMSKAYFESILESGDPLFVDQTGTNPRKVGQQIAEAKAAGYRTSVILVIVPLTVNQIRNVLRDRHVSPDEITRQRNLVIKSYMEVAPQADKARVIVNRNDAADIKAYKEHAAQINAFIRAKTSYSSLYDLIAHEAKSELTDWSDLLKSAT